MVVHYRLKKKTRASGLIALIETLKDCSPKSTILSILVQKSRKVTLTNNARAIVFYRRIVNSGRTNQNRGFPIEHS